MSEGKSGKSCLYIGCLSIIIILLIILVIVGYYVNKIRNLAFEYTSPTAIKLQTVQWEENNKDDIEDKFDKFTDLIEKDMPAKINLTAKEINILLASNKDLEILKDKIVIAIDDNNISGEICIPITELPGWIPFPNGRFLTGKAEFAISATNGGLVVNLDSLEVAGEELPKEVSDWLKSENLAKKLYEDPKNLEWLKKLENIIIENNQLIIEINDK